MPAVFLPGESHGQKSLAGYGPWGHKELDVTERLSTVQHINENKGIVNIKVQINEIERLNIFELVTEIKSDSMDKFKKLIHL